jgi:hypothetical protein
LGLRRRRWVGNDLIVSRRAFDLHGLLDSKGEVSYPVCVNVPTRRLTPLFALSSLRLPRFSWPWVAHGGGGERLDRENPEFFQGVSDGLK